MPSISATISCILRLDLLISSIAETAWVIVLPLWRALSQVWRALSLASLAVIAVWATAAASSRTAAADSSSAAAWFSVRFDRSPLAEAISLAPTRTACAAWSPD
jgi:hypothetical protein